MKSDWEIIRELDLPDKKEREIIKAFNEMPYFMQGLDFRWKYIIALGMIQQFKNKYGDQYI